VGGEKARAMPEAGVGIAVAELTNGDGKKNTVISSKDSQNIG